MLKRGILILFGVTAFFVFAQFKSEAQNIEVNVRFSENPEGKRIVFESTDETFIKNTSASVTRDLIQVRFPSAPVLRYRNEVNLEIFIQGSVVNIRPKEPFRVKTLYLSSPPRFSIDVLKTSDRSSPVGPSLIPSTGGERDRIEETASKQAASRITIDPGHGGFDSGIIIKDLREKDITLSLAKEMESMILKKNRSVFLTRRSDQFMSITDRAVAANQKASHVFLSLHISLSEGFVINISRLDSSGNETEELFNMMYRQRRYLDKSRALAEAIGKAIKEDLKAEVIYREIPLLLLQSIGSPAIMIEIPPVMVDDKGKRARLSQTLLKGIEYANQ